MSLMTIRGYTTEQLLDAAAFLKTEEGNKRREANNEKARRRAELKKTGDKLTGAQEFWRLYGIAAQNVFSQRGANWYLDQHNYRWGRIPAKLCSIKGRGATHRRNRDQKIPHAVYWPGQMIPDVGIEFAGNA